MALLAAKRRRHDLPLSRPPSPDVRQTLGVSWQRRPLLHLKPIQTLWKKTSPFLESLIKPSWRDLNNCIPREICNYEMLPPAQMVIGNTFHKDKSHPWTLHMESLTFTSLLKSWIERTITTTGGGSDPSTLPPVVLGTTKS